MRIDFDTQKLKKVIFDIYNMTKIVITIFDTDFRPITDVGPWQPYCLDVGDEHLSACEKCNREHLLLARERRETITYTCHAGIVESVTPIVFHDTVVAYIMLGKFRDAEQRFSSPDAVRDAALTYGLPVDKMLGDYYALPLVSTSYLDSVISNLKICISYILNEKLISLNGPVLSELIEQYIDMHLDEKITIETLCEYFGVTKDVLYSIFKREFNDTIQNFILKKRLATAAGRLLDTDSPVNDISAEFGFVDPAYFIRQFKKLYGTTPSKFRKRKDAPAD